MTSSRSTVAMSNQRRLFEVLAAAATGLGKIIFVDWLQYKLIFILTACLFWLGYVIYRYRQQPEILRYWGFTRHHFWAAFGRLAPYALTSVVLFLIYGLYFNTLILNWHLLPILLLYPLWGVIQQYLVVGLVAGNLADQDRWPFPKALIVLLTATLFAIIHYPDWLLVAGTFVLAIVYTLFYLRYRNLWVLGILHGWLGGFFYFFVLERDAWVEVFG